MWKKVFFSAMACLVSSLSVVAATNEVDGITAATVNKSCKFTTPFTLTSTSATIKWTEGRSDGTAILSYGIPPAALTKKTISGNDRSSKSVTLTGLIPGSTYSIIYDVTKSGETPYEATGSLTTPAETKVSFQTMSKQKPVLLEFLDHSIYFGQTALSGDRLTIIDSRGQLLANHELTNTQSSVALPKSAKGMYFLTYTRNGALIDNRKVILMH